MKDETGLSRRKFLADVSAGAAALGLTRMGFAKGKPTNSRKPEPVSVAIIGIGFRGTHLLQLSELIENIRVGALCDVFQPHLNRAKMIAGASVPAYSDYRQVLDRKDIDGVLIATPEHLHASMALDALDAGKDVFCEKSMTHTLSETRQLISAMKTSDRILQIGLQWRFRGHNQKVVQLIKSGAIGRPLLFRGTMMARLPWYIHSSDDPKLNRLLNWRAYREYTAGLVSEFGAHILDQVNWILGNTSPARCAGFGGLDHWKNGRNTYDNISLTYEYPNGERLALLSSGFDSHILVPLDIIGTEGSIALGGVAARLFRGRTHQRPAFERYVRAVETNIQMTTAIGSPSYRLDDTDSGDDSLQIGSVRSEGQSDWGAFNQLVAFADSIQTRTKPLVDVNVGARTAISALMGNEAIDHGRVASWPEQFEL
ncbi:MAG: hypothetical protein A2289_03880 [Deltaproteobacteria bacterium RIFOXYA12_FULL_58_15]|nr:MAG: hypothetical protein A2289_03880 [Deltaproteobacteria bacterium RIFOXYA12_FULL_58_15]